MYRKIVWCYLIVLTLLDISLNTKLSAQGKSHGNGVSVHESLMEGISLQEWGKEAGSGGGRAAPPDAVALWPARLAFGGCALAAPHARTVTLTNTANETIHLASVAGTTPDFHASFFETKTLVPGANTSFSVVYLGRREGPVSTHLFIHTSKGVLNYHVSAVGVASEWRVWPLVGVRVPVNATLEPLLTLYNPTDTTVQVSEVYSSASWVGLQLPEGGGSAARALWSLPPHAARPLVRLRIRAPPAHTAHAYIRIKTEGAAGLVVCVEAGGGAPGEYLDPLHLRLRARTTADPTETFTFSAGSSAETDVSVTGEVWGAQCSASHVEPPPPPPPHARPAANGVRSESAAARVTLLRDTLAARQEVTPAATLTLDYGALWAGAGAGAEVEGSAWCAGWVRVGRAAAPYSVRLLRGALSLHPAELHLVTALGEPAYRQQEVSVHNELQETVLVHSVHFPPDILEHLHTESLAPLVVGAGARVVAARLRLRPAAAPAALRSAVTVHTNLSDYSLPVLVYEGRLHFEWEWRGAGQEGALQLGAVGTSSARAVRARLHNRGAASLCVQHAHSRLAGGTLQVVGARCVPPGGHTAAELRVVAPARPGPLAGLLSVRTQHADTTVRVDLTAHHGHLRVAPLLLDHVAPYVWSRAPLVLENSMSLRMRVTGVSQPPDNTDPALSYIPAEQEEARWASAHGAVGELLYAAEARCAPRCALGLNLDEPEGAAWAARGALPADQALAEDEPLWRARLAAFPREHSNLSVSVHTTRVVESRCAVVARHVWPALSGPPPHARSAVGSPAALRLAVHNPSVRALLVQAVIGGAERASAACAHCEWAAGAFSVGEWSGAQPWGGGYVLLPPGARAHLALSFQPPRDATLAAMLYLRNNLTVLESVPVRGRGAHPQFSLGGRRANSTAAIVVEVSACGGAVRRALLLRNTGAVPVRLRDWRLAGAPCLARGFRLRPCGALALAPNETRELTLSYTPDWTRARAAVPLSVRAGAARADFALVGAAPARLLAECAPAAPRPPFEPALRTAGAALALAALAVAVALAAVDAERALRRHRGARAPSAPRPPLDLRALGRAEPAPAAARPAPPPRRRRTPRRRAAATDAAAERRAFELWRAEVSRRAPGEESRSSEEGEAESPPAPAPAPRGDASSSSADSSPPPRDRCDSYPGARPRGSLAPASSASDTSAGSERSEPEDECPARAPHHPAPHCAPEPDRDHDHDRDHPHDHHHQDFTAPPDTTSEGVSHRENGSARRSAEAGGAGSEARPRTRSGSARAGARKERGARRRTRAVSPAAARASPPRAEGRAPGTVRWGDSWSSVVSRGAAAAAGPGPAPPRPPPAPLAPIGSDVRRRAASHSLFYYGDPWPPAEPPPAAPLPPPPPPRAPADYMDEKSGGFRSLESVWGTSMEPHPAAAAWLWGGAPAAALRPPPGFGGAAAARVVRPYDPFRSLASIWTPAALDWRQRAGAPEPPPATEADPQPRPADD